MTRAVQPRLPDVELHELNSHRLSGDLWRLKPETLARIERGLTLMHTSPHCAGHAFSLSDPRAQKGRTA
ncbi:MAG TPA: hypothetical protein VIP05_31205 [Burkholderiaceae bacterium]